jgi:phosphoribosylaminoimidazole (AIR) synthetase
MGIGMTILCSQGNADEIMKNVPEAIIVGEVIEQQGEDRVIIL